MTAKEIKELTAEELSNKLQELKQELFNLRIQGRTGQLENTARVKTVRRTIARVLTEENARAKAKVD